MAVKGEVYEDGVGILEQYEGVMGQGLDPQDLTQCGLAE